MFSLDRVGFIHILFLHLIFFQLMVLKMGSRTRDTEIKEQDRWPRYRKMYTYVVRLINTLVLVFVVLKLSRKYVLSNFSVFGRSLFYLGWVISFNLIVGEVPWHSSLVLSSVVRCNLIRSAKSDVSVFVSLWHFHLSGEKWQQIAKRCWRISWS